MRYHAGHLRDRVTPVLVTRALDENYQEVETIQRGTALWAEVRAQTAREMLRADQVDREQRFVVTMRANATLTTDHRLEWGTRTLEIGSIAPLPEQRGFIECICTEVV